MLSGLRPFACLLLFGFSLMATPEAAAQRVRAYVSADSVSVGERFRLTIAVDENSVARPIFPDPARGDTLLGDLVVLQILDRGSAPRSDSIVYEVTTFALDSAVVPPVPVRLAVETDTFTAGTPSLRIPVRSVVPPEAEDIRDLAPLEEFPRPWWFWALLALGVLALAVLTYLVVRRLRRKPVPAPISASPESPLQEAERRLMKLEQEEPADPIRLKAFYDELADVLRRYLERRLEIPALEQTTRELVMTMEEKRVEKGLPDDTSERLRAVLSSADLVKFADRRPPAEEGRRLVGATLELVREIEHSLAPRLVAPLPSAEPTVSTDRP